MNNDLISRKALKEDLLKRSFYPVIIKCALEAAPAVDAVEVVRCKDCKHYRQNKYSGEDDMWCMCWSDWLPTEPDDFCSYGERKEK